MKKIDIKSLSLSIIEDSEVYFVNSMTNSRLDTLPLQFIELINRVIDSEVGCLKYHSKDIVDKELQQLIGLIELWNSCKSRNLLIVSLLGQMGIVSQEGKIVVPFKYYDLRIDEEYNHIRANSNSILMTINGERLLEGFSQIGKFSEGYAIVRGPILSTQTFHIWGIMDESLNIKPLENHNSSFECTSIKPFERGFARGIYDYAGLNISYLFNKQGEVVISSNDEIVITDFFILCVSLKEIQVNTLSGEYLFDINDSYYQRNPWCWRGFEAAEVPSDYVIRVYKSSLRGGRKWGYVNTSYEEVIPFIYDDAGLMVNGVAKIKLNGKYGLIDSIGRLLIAPSYDVIGRLKCNKLLLVNIGGQINNNKKLDGGLNALMSIDGKLLTPVEYDGFQELGVPGYIKTRKNKLFGLVNERGEEIIPCTYSSVKEFSEGLCCVNEGGEIIEHNGRRGFFGGKWSYVNDKNEKIIELAVDHARNFYNSLAAVRIGGKYGFINLKGQLVIPPQFDEVKDFQYREAEVRIGDLYNTIDQNGVITGKWGKSEEADDNYDNDDQEENNRERDRDTWYALTGGQYGEYPEGGYNYDSLADSLGL